MNSLNKYALLLFALLSVAGLKAQQEGLASLYLENRLFLNPGYAGSRDVLSATAQYRHQWVGFDDAPRTTMVTVHAPLANKRLALGGSIYDDRIGVTQETGIQLNYAYRLPVSSTGRLSFGLNGGVAYHRAALTQLTLIDEIDQSFAADEQRWVPLAGAGVWFDTDDAYLGFSVPRLLSTRFAPSSDSRQVRHYYLSGGYVHTANDKLRIRPTATVRLSEGGAPMQADVDLSFELMQRIWIGGGYRTSAAAKAHAQLMLPGGLAISYGYDFDVNDLSPYTAGSHEVAIRFDLLPKDGKAVLSPRQSPHRHF